MNEQLIAQLQLLIELAKTKESFRLKDNDQLYIIDSNHIFKQEDKDLFWWIPVSLTLNELCSKEIIRKPWKPKVGEKYWRWDFDDSHEPITSYCDWREWGCDVYDLTMYAFGNCFRTKEECESHTEVRDKLIAMRKEYE